MYFQSLRYSYIGLFFGVAVVLGYAVGRRSTDAFTPALGAPWPVLFGVASGFNRAPCAWPAGTKELARDAAAKNKAPKPLRAGSAHAAKENKKHSIP